MQTHTQEFSFMEQFPLLDTEFDKVELAPAGDHQHVEPLLLSDDLGWEDQLDNGEEMSL